MATLKPTIVAVGEHCVKFRWGPNCRAAAAARD